MNLWRRLLLCAAMLCAAVIPARAQEEEGLPIGHVGIPYFYNLLQDVEEEEGEGVTFTVTGGTVPPGLTLSPSGIISGIPTAPGGYLFTVRFVINTEDGPFPFPFDLPIFIQVTGTVQTGIAVAPGGISVVLAAGAGAQVQAVTVSNLGTAEQTFSVVARMETGVNWLSVTPGAGTLGSFGKTTLQVTINPGTLAPGTYRGSIVVSNPGAPPRTIPVTVTISAASQSLQLSQTGLRFVAVQNGPAPPAESVRVLGVTTFAAAVSTTSGGTWLTATPAGSAVNVAVSTAGLAPGDYYGQVSVTSPGVDNSPQTIVVVLTVLPANTSISPQPSTTGVIFSGRRNGANPAAQTVTLRNLAAASIPYAAWIFYENGTNWLTVTPLQGTVTTAQPTSLNFAVNTAGLAAGVYRAEVVISFPLDDFNAPVLPRVRIAVLLVVLPALQQSLTGGPRLAEGCTPKQLLPVFTKLGAGFANPAGWPAALAVTIVDDCGEPMNNGAVQAAFSNGDAPLALLGTGNGSWSATWQPQNVQQSLVITVSATQTAPVLTGSATLGGSLDANPSVPAVDTGGVVSAASFTGFQPVAPGGLVSIFGTALSNGLLISTTVPFGTQLGQTAALLGGRPLALQFSAASQVNAIVPFDVPVNSTQQLLITNGTQVSLPQPIVVAAATPAIFTRNQQGFGAGIVAAFKPDGRAVYPLTEIARASAGDVLVIYATGLGAVDRAVPVGGVPTAVTQTTNPVTMTIGGVTAQVVFAGLSPEFPGVYQVNAVMPTGVTAGLEVPVVLTVAGQSSPPVTITVQ